MILVCDRQRQLGNRLFVFAHLLAFAKENNLKLSNLSFAEYAKYFEGTKNDLWCRFPIQQSFFTNLFLRKIIYRISLLMEKIIFRGKISNSFIGSFRIEEEDENNNELYRQFISFAKTNSVTFFQGWGFRDNDSFEKHSEFIRNYFSPISFHQKNIDKIIFEAKSNSEILIGIHIRQSDYKNHLGGKYFFSVEQYKDKMRELKNVFPEKKTKFLICSDEKQDEKIFSEFDFVFGTGHFIEDMYSFSQCDFLMGPPSTYTMWASFYGNVPLCILEEINLLIDKESFKLHK